MASVEHAVEMADDVHKVSSHNNKEMSSSTSESQLGQKIKRTQSCQSRTLDGHFTRVRDLIAR